jgi:hypothetical protein
VNDNDETVRRLLGVAMEDVPPGIDLLRGVRTRNRGRAVRIRAMAASGLTVIAAAATATALLVSQAPSALAQVAQAASRTAAQSYQVTSTSQALGAFARHSAPVLTSKGEFDPARGTGEEWDADGMRVLYAGGYMYLPLRNVQFPDQRGRIPAGKIWLRSPEPRTAAGMVPGRILGLMGPFGADMSVFNPQDLLTGLESVSRVREIGPAAGLGWTGRAYAFTTGPHRLGQQITLLTSGTVDVDQQGRVRRLEATETIEVSAPAGTAIKHEWQRKIETTFGDFGVAVPVSAPPASETMVLSPAGLTDVAISALPRN